MREPSSSPREPFQTEAPREQPAPASPPREPSRWKREAPPPLPPEPRRNPSRSARNKPIELFSPKLKGKSHDKPRYATALMAALALTVPSGITPVSAHHLQFQAQGCDPFTNTQEFLHPGILQSPMALKAKKSRDPDLPSLRESLSGQHSEEFWAAMDTEIDSLEEKGTWTVTDRSEVPADAKVVPATWVQRIK